MNLTDFASPMKAKDHYVKAEFAGFPGGGKTFTATDFIVGLYKQLGIKKPLLMVDNEGGHRWIMRKFKDAGIDAYLKETDTIPDIQQAIRLVDSGEIGLLFIDSLTNIYAKYVNDYMKKNSRTFMEMLDWGRVQPAWREAFNEPFKRAKGNIIFTGRGGFTYEMETNAKGKKEFVKSGVKAKLEGETGHEPDLIMWMESVQDLQGDGTVLTFNDMQFLKSRYAPYHGKTFRNPTYDKVFKPLITELLALEIGDVSGVTNEDGGAPSEQFDDRRQRKEIIFEKIAGKLDLLGLGATKDDKAIKAAMKQHAFGTTSDTEIKRMSAEDVEHHGALMLELIDEFAVKAKAQEFDTAESALEFINSWEPDMFAEPKSPGIGDANAEPPDELEFEETK